MHHFRTGTSVGHGLRRSSRGSFAAMNESTRRAQPGEFRTQHTLRLRGRQQKERRQAAQIACFSLARSSRLTPCLWFQVCPVSSRSSWMPIGERARLICDAASGDTGKVGEPRDERSGASRYLTVHETQSSPFNSRLRGIAPLLVRLQHDSAPAPASHRAHGRGRPADQCQQ